MKRVLRTPPNIARNRMLQVFYSLLDILFPAQCLGCGGTISNSEPGICVTCVSKIRKIDGRCPVCSGIVYDSACSICSTRNFYISKNITLWDYSGIMKDIITGLKFKKNKAVSSFLSRLLAEAFHYFHDTVHVVSFIPMNNKKKRFRGYNQSELIAQGVGRLLGLPCERLLKERRKTGIQRHMAYNERFFNVIERYAVSSKKSFTGKTILLIDDVLTTGATINECARLLLKAGAGKVYSMTLARVHMPAY